MNSSGKPIRRLQFVYFSENRREREKRERERKVFARSETCTYTERDGANRVMTLPVMLHCIRI
ncbi:unnamed protein product [Prunus armeniaca]|uniref:Uncharacterized protein n=1 Tax=Prunus armeniaca TaxID=36596 RepID=A0A6J5XXG3_PRUAR|nr:unnamed protein product [Prunus armeniaca]CAB4316942.1 unnamed protein product [Prunus armeniaca]